MKVTITTLEMLEAPTVSPRAFPESVRLDRVAAMSPEYARFLYGLIGGPWFWTERLGWTREQWERELDVPGTEFWILYESGMPLGYAHLQPQPKADGTHTEIRYFGLAEPAIGRHLGGTLLEHAAAAAWTLHERFELPAVSRVWVHTCTLDGPAALANYRARGFEICAEDDVDETHPEQPLGSWVSTGGPPA